MSLDAKLNYQRSRQYLAIHRSRHRGLCIYGEVRYMYRRHTRPPPLPRVCSQSQNVLQWLLLLDDDDTSHSSASSTPHIGPRAPVPAAAVSIPYTVPIYPPTPRLPASPVSCNILPVRLRFHRAQREIVVLNGQLRVRTLPGASALNAGGGSGARDTCMLSCGSRCCGTRAGEAVVVEMEVAVFPPLSLAPGGGPVVLASGRRVEHVGAVGAVGAARQLIG